MNLKGLVIYWTHYLSSQRNKEQKGRREKQLPRISNGVGDWGAALDSAHRREHLSALRLIEDMLGVRPEPWMQQSALARSSGVGFLLSSGTWLPSTKKTGAKSTGFHKLKNLTAKAPSTAEHSHIVHGQRATCKFLLTAKQTAPWIYCFKAVRSSLSLVFMNIKGKMPVISMLPHTCENGLYQKGQEEWGLAWGVENSLSFSTSGCINWSSLYGKQHGDC